MLIFFLFFFNSESLLENFELFSLTDQNANRKDVINTGLILPNTAENDFLVFSFKTFIW